MATATTATTATKKPIKVEKSPVPEFINAINSDYQGQVAHLFILDGNIYDYIDNAGGDLGIDQIMAAIYDYNIQKAINPSLSEKGAETGLSKSGSASPKTRIMGVYNGRSLEFPHENSRQMWIKAMTSILGPEDIKGLGGENFYLCNKGMAHAMRVFNAWFFCSREIANRNKAAREQAKQQVMELSCTWIFKNSDGLFPQGSMVQLGEEKNPIMTMRDWAQDPWVGMRNRIILMARHANDIHESLRTELSRVHHVKKPALVDRREWLVNFAGQIKTRVDREGPLSIGDNLSVREVSFSEDFDIEQFAIQSAGMNRKQMKDVIMSSWRTSMPIDFTMVRTRKKEALDAEYNGMIDIKEPEFGFEQIGGQEHFKRYCMRKVIRPLKTGNRRNCSRGVLLTGPPGTGKSMASWALAKEADLNFLLVDLGKVFGGVVGESEKNMRATIEGIEAASPCIVFIDELDSVLSAGRQSAGDSGTAGRVFNSFMTWMSDPGRRGRVVVIAASNRPDMLDPALLRPGRFDAKIPMLAVKPGDGPGRYEVLKAQTRKHKIVLHKELVATKNDKDNGLGRLLLDMNRIWTPAEQEQLLEAAFDETMASERTLPSGDPDLEVRTEDWNIAMDSIIPNTGQVKKMTELALAFVDNLRYVPDEWRDEAREIRSRRAEESTEE